MHQGLGRIMDGFFKEKKYLYNVLLPDIKIKIKISDLVLALTPAVDETVPWMLYHRLSFTKSRKLLLAQWLIMANILSHAYKGALLSSLVTIRYTEPLDTVDQMVESGLPFYVLGGTVLEWLSKTDPRDGVKQLNDRRFDMPYNGVVEEKYLKM